MNWIALAALTLAASTAWGANLPARGGQEALIYDIARVQVTVDDQVTGGCLPQPAALESAAEVALRRNGISVTVDLGVPIVYIAAFGFPVMDGTACVVTLEVSLLKPIRAVVPHADSPLTSRTTTTNIAIDVQASLRTLFGPKHNMQDQLEREAEKGANEVFILIDRAKDKVRSNWPELWKAAVEANPRLGERN